MGVILILDLDITQAFAISGILQSSSGFLPHILQSPSSFFNIGLLLAQVPLNSLPVTMCLMLIMMKEIAKTPPMISNIVKNSAIGNFYDDFITYNSEFQYLQK